jgi:hypothetical protein
MIILNDGQVFDTESELEPKFNDSFMYKGKNFRISECHQSAVPEMWDFVITLAR